MGQEMMSSAPGESSLLLGHLHPQFISSIQKYEAEEETPLDENLEQKRETHEPEMDNDPNMKYVKDDPEIKTGISRNQQPTGQVSQTADVNNVKQPLKMLKKVSGKVVISQQATTDVTKASGLGQSQKEFQTSILSNANQHAAFGETGDKGSTPNNKIIFKDNISPTFKKENLEVDKLDHAPETPEDRRENLPDNANLPVYDQNHIRGENNIQYTTIRDYALHNGLKGKNDQLRSNMDGNTFQKPQINSKQLQGKGGQQNTHEGKEGKKTTLDDNILKAAEQNNILIKPKTISYNSVKTYNASKELGNEREVSDSSNSNREGMEIRYGRVRKYPGGSGGTAVLMNTSLLGGETKEGGPQTRMPLNEEYKGSESVSELTDKKVNQEDAGKIMHGNRETSHIKMKINPSEIDNFQHGQETAQMDIKENQSVRENERSKSQNSLAKDYGENMAGQNQLPRTADFPGEITSNDLNKQQQRPVIQFREVDNSNMQDNKQDVFHRTASHKSRNQGFLQKGEPIQFQAIKSYPGQPKEIKTQNQGWDAFNIKEPSLLSNKEETIANNNNVKYDMENQLTMNKQNSNQNQGNRIFYRTLGNYKDLKKEIPNNLDKENKVMLESDNKEINKEGSYDEKYGGKLIQYQLKKEPESVQNKFNLENGKQIQFDQIVIFQDTENLMSGVTNNQPLEREPIQNSPVEKIQHGFSAGLETKGKEITYELRNTVENGSEDPSQQGNQEQGVISGHPKIKQLTYQLFGKYILKKGEREIHHARLEIVGGTENHGQRHIDPDVQQFEINPDMKSGLLGLFTASGSETDEKRDPVGTQTAATMKPLTSAKASNNLQGKDISYIGKGKITRARAEIVARRGPHRARPDVAETIDHEISPEILREGTESVTKGTHYRTGIFCINIFGARIVKKKLKDVAVNTTSACSQV
jgi:hypothetical protein